jgi:hypothetical protein
MTIIEKYCTAVRKTGNEIRINTEESPTEVLYNKVAEVASQHGVACHVDRTGFLIKPKTRQTPTN